MGINIGMFTSNKSEWETPQEFYEELNKEFGFTLDVCALPKNTKHRAFLSPEGNGSLNTSWANVGIAHTGKPNICWMNPPYGRKIGEWVERAYVESLKGATVVCLLPARTDTKWWHNYCMKGEIRFIKGRIKFIDPDNRNSKPQPAPFPSAIVVFKIKESK